MIDIVITLVFAVPLLILMAYPAMRIVEFLETKMKIDEKLYNTLTVAITIILSLILGILLKIT
ncbi:MAG: hypothetical protein U9N59_11845 [Campylobacterota bacterium]|nr:hypothetical protein [Campylobacterota bacterium]